MSDEFDVIVGEADDDIDASSVREEDVDYEELEDDFDDDAPETDDDDDSVDESPAAGEFAIIDEFPDDEPNAETEEDESFEEGDDDVAAYTGDDEEEETLFDDNVLELPTTVAVTEGDTCIICEVNGEPTVIGVIGKGDETADSIKEAWDKAQGAFDKATESSQAAVSALSKAEQAAKDAQTALEQAGGGASHAWTDEAGLHLTMADKSTVGPNVLVNKAGMDIYPDGNRHSLASFTKDGVYLRDYSVKSTLDGDVVTNDVIASFTKDGAVFGSDGDQVGALTKEGLVVGSSDKKMATVTSDGMVVYDSQGRPAATFDDNGMQLAIGGQMVSQFGPSAIALGGAGTTSITMAGNAVLNVSKLCIGDFSNPITSRDELKGDAGKDGEPGKDGVPGKDGKDGKDGIDVTSQYINYQSSGSYAGLNMVSTSGLSGYHTNINNSSFNIMKGTTNVGSFSSDSYVSNLAMGSNGEIMSRNDQSYMIVGLNSGSGTQLHLFDDGTASLCKASGSSLDNGTLSLAYLNVGKEVMADDTYYAPSHSGGGVFAKGVGIMMGNGGSNHGLWSTVNGEWIVYTDGNGAGIFKGNCRPSSNGGSSCGHSSYKWSQVYATKGTINTSSRKVKENIVPISDKAARKLLDVEVVRFDYKEGVVDDTERKGWYGVIAEDVHDVFPHAVGDWDAGVDEEGNEIHPGVYYDAFIPHMMRMIQLQQEEIDELKQQRSRAVPLARRQRRASMGRRLKRTRRS